MFAPPCDRLFTTDCGRTRSGLKRGAPVRSECLEVVDSSHSGGASKPTAFMAAVARPVLRVNGGGGVGQGGGGANGGSGVTSTEGVNNCFVTGGGAASDGSTTPPVEGTNAVAPDPVTARAHPALSPDLYGHGPINLQRDTRCGRALRRRTILYLGTPNYPGAIRPKVIHCA